MINLCNMKRLSGEQWRALVGQRVLLTENPDVRPTITTRGTSDEPAQSWQQDESRPRVNEFTVHEVAPSVQFVNLLCFDHCGNSWYRTDEILFVEALGKSKPVKKPKGDDPKATAYATA